MGQIASLTKIRSENKSNDPDLMGAIDETNGMILNGTYLPPEILTLILSFVDSTSLSKHCPLVCHQWNNLIRELVWKIKAESFFNCRLKKFDPKLYMLICIQNPFDRNLLSNTCGENGRNAWKIESEGGDGFAIENPPSGCEVLPKELGDLTSCFATSYHSCSKSQVVDLVTLGMQPDIIDTLQPPIYVSEWYGSRFDCGCIYEMVVDLLDAKQKIVREMKFRTTVQQWQGGDWVKVERTLENYGPGVRYIYFYHGGQDTQFWAGHYGSKMAGATVKFESSWIRAS